MRERVVLVLAAVGLFALGFMAGRTVAHSRSLPERTEEEIVTVHDTIRDMTPVAAATRPVKKAATKLPIAETAEPAEGDIAVTADSVVVEVPIEQKVYESDDYRAWVSGYQASLDSIEVYRHTRYVAVNPAGEHKPKRWHIGLTAGYGVTPHGAEPYVGIGITYSIISF